MAEKCIFRSKKSSNFVSLPNETARDKSLSFRARGLLLMVMSHSDEWVIHQGWLATQGQEGREAIRAAMKELEQAGYALHEEIREKGKIVGSRWTFYDLPQEERTTKTKWNQPEDGKPSGGKPYDGKPSGGNPSTIEDGEKEKHKREAASLSSQGVVEGKEKKPRKGSIKATLEEVEAFAESIGQPKSDGEGMFYYFEAKGWPKNWQATIRQWKVFKYLPSLKGRGGSQSKEKYPEYDADGNYIGWKNHVLG